MRGISPVITTVLLLLMAISAVGGAWLWYQQMQTESMSSGMGQVESIRKSAVSLSVDEIQCDSTNYKITFANAGSSSVSLDNVTVEQAGSLVAYDDSTISVSANSLSDNTLASTATNCASGTTYHISARIGSQYIIRDYPQST